MPLVGSQKQMAILLWESGAVKWSDEGFELKHHEVVADMPRSPIRFDIRTPDNPRSPGPLAADAVKAIALSMYRRSLRGALKYNHILGIPFAGVPLVEAFAEQTDDPSVSILRIGKTVDEGTGQRRITGPVVGEYKRNDRVLVLDDVMTAGCSKIETFTVLEAAGLVVAGVLTVIDREQGGSNLLQHRGYQSLSVATLSDVVEFYVEQGFLTGDQGQQVANYLVEYHRRINQ